MEKMKKIFFENKYFFYVLALAAFLLFFRVSVRTFWMDETMVLNYLNFGVGDFWKYYWHVPDNHPPLFYFLVLVVSKLLSWNELAVRLVSVVAGLGIVSLVYIFSLEVTGNKKIATLSSFFTAFSSYFVLISQMARYHSLAAFFSLLTFYYFYKTFKTNSKYWKWYLVSFALVAYTDYPHFFYVACITNFAYLFLLLKRKSDTVKFLKWLIGQLVVAVLCLPLVWMIYNRIVFQGDGGWNYANLLGNSWLNIIGGILFHFYAYFFGENIFPWNYVFFAMGVVVFLSIGLGLYGLVSHKFWKTETAIFTILGFLLVTMNTLFMNVADPRYNFLVYPKFGFVAYPIIIMAFVTCIFAVKSTLFRNVAFILWFIVGAYGLYNFYSLKNYLNGSYFRTFGQFEFVRDHSEKGEYLALTPDASEGVYTFYHQKYFSGLLPLDFRDIQKTPSGAKVWFFSTGSDEVEGSLKPEDRVPAGYKIIQKYDAVPLDPEFKLVKEKILHRPSYEYKYTVFLLQRI